MLKIFLIFFVSFAVTSAQSDTALAEVPCRLYLDFFYVNVGYSHICLIDVFKPELTQRYRIKSERKEEVKGIDIRNWMIQFVPSYVSENFPNMEIYAATANAITQVGPENFKGLNKLKALYLSHNRLEEIPAETFAGLDALQHLHLRKIGQTLIDLNLSYEFYEKFTNLFGYFFVFFRV